MKVRILAHYDGGPNEENEENLRRLARSLTKDVASVTVARVPHQADALVVEFTMPTEAQYKAVDRVDAGMHFWCLDAMDTTISFPRDRPPRKRRSRTKRTPTSGRDEP